MQTQRGALTGINVLDMGTGGVGPWAASLLAMLGANVIKIEPPSGDLLRIMPPLTKGSPTAYAFCNMGKRCGVFDLKDPETTPMLTRLLQEADVLMQNMRPGAMDRLGLDYEAVKQINPSIVYVECPAWGADGPMRDLPGAAGIADSFGGFASLNGDQNSRAERMRYPYSDFNAASYITAATLLALYARDRTGQGQWVSLSQLTSIVAIQITRIAEYFATGEDPIPLGHSSASTAPHQAFLCQDRRFLAVGIETQPQWGDLCRALKREDLLDDVRFASNADRVNHREQLATILQEVFSDKPTRWWALQLSKHNIPYGYFYDFETLRNHAQVTENGFMPVAEISVMGQLHTGAPPWQFSKLATQLGVPPAPGQHNQQIEGGGFGSSASIPGKKARSQSTEMPPLTGIRVVDVSQGICGPYISLSLALAGAHVIKVEPPEGDYARKFAPLGPTGDGAAFLILNRNKESIALDWESEEGATELKKLLTSADVFIEDWGPGKAEALGLGYDQLTRHNPRLSYCAISPFGEKGPMKDMASSELVIQAISSVTNTLGEPDSPPVRIGADIANLNTAVFALQGILAALHDRERSGEGQRIAVSMLGSLLTMWGALWMAWSNPDEWIGPYCDNDVGPRNYGLRTMDKEVYFGTPLISKGGAEDEIIEAIRKLGVKEIAEHPLITASERDPVAVNNLLREVRNDLRLWEKYFVTMTAEEIVRRTSGGGIITVPVNSVSDVLFHPQTQTWGMVREIHFSDTSTMRVLDSPWKGSWGEVQPTPLSRGDIGTAFAGIL